MKVDQVKLRKKVGLFLTVLILAIFVWYWFCIAPLLVITQ